MLYSAKDLDSIVHAEPDDNSKEETLILKFNNDNYNDNNNIDNKS